MNHVRSAEAFPRRRSGRAPFDFLFVLIVVISVPLLAQESVDEKVIAQIKAEGFQRSAVMETLSWLTDVHGQVVREVLA